MAFQPVANSAIITWTFTYDGVGKEYTIDHTYTKGSPFTDEQVASLVEQAHAEFTIRGMDDYTPLTAQLVRVYGRDLEEEFAVGYVNEDEVPGTLDQPMAPPNVAVWVKFSGTSGDPPRHGGVFWPFTRESEVSNAGVLTSYYTTTFEAAYAEFAAAVGGSSPLCDHSIVSRYHKTPGGTPPYLRDPATTSLVTAYNVRAMVGSQRDRRA